jgi:hypothetical protein
MTHTCHYLCSEIVTVTYENETGEIRQAIANLEEIASDQAVLLFEQPPCLGASISLEIQGRDLFGIARALLHDAALGWFVTVSLDTSSRWSRAWFAPKHLLAVCGCTRKGMTSAKVRDLDPTRNAEENVPVSFIAAEAAL